MWADGQLGGSDCETLREGLVAQPVNTASSAAYVLAGVWVAWYARGAQERDRPWTWGYAGLLVLVGVGSIDFHGPQGPGAKPLHDWPIAALVALAVAFAVRNWRTGGRAFPGWSRGLVTALLVVWACAPIAFVLGRTSALACRPGSSLQPHGLWHILTAVGFALVFALLAPRGGGRR